MSVKEQASLELGFLSFEIFRNFFIFGIQNITNFALTVGLVYRVSLRPDTQTLMELTLLISCHSGANSSTISSLKNFKSVFQKLVHAVFS